MSRSSRPSGWRHEPTARPHCNGLPDQGGARPARLVAGQARTCCRSSSQCSIAYWEQTPVIPTGRREPHACTRIRQALHDAGIEFVGHAKPGVRLCQNANYVSRPPSRARPRHGVKRVSPHWAMLARTKTRASRCARRKPSAPCGARTRTGAPCRRTGLGNGRCANHGGRRPGRERQRVVRGSPRCSASDGPHGVRNDATMALWTTTSN